MIGWVAWLFVLTYNMILLFVVIWEVFFLFSFGCYVLLFHIIHQRHLSSTESDHAFIYLTGVC